MGLLGEKLLKWRLLHVVSDSESKRFGKILQQENDILQDFGMTLILEFCSLARRFSMFLRFEDFRRKEASARSTERRRAKKRKKDRSGEIGGVNRGRDAEKQRTEKQCSGMDIDSRNSRKAELER